MAAEEAPIDIPIAVPSAELAADQLDQLAASMMRADKQAKALHATTDAHSRVVRQQVKEVQAQAYAEKAREQQLQRSAQAVTYLSTATKAANTNALTFHQSTTKSATTVAALSNALTRVVPSFTAFHGAVGAGAQTIGQFMGLLGGGAGLATGGVIAAVTLLGAAWNHEAEKAENFAKATAEANKKIQEQIDLLSKRTSFSDAQGAVSSANANASRWSAMSMGVGSREDYASADLAFEKRIAESKTQQALYGKQGDAAGQSRMIAEQVALEKKRRYFAEQARTAAAEEDDLAMSGGPMGQEVSGPKSIGSRARRAAAAIGTGEAEANASFSEAESAAWKEQQEREAISNAILDEHEKKKLDALQADRDATEERIRLSDELRAKQIENEEATQRKRAEVVAVAVQGSSVIASAGLKSLYELAKGHKLSAKAFIEGIGDQLFASGAAHVLQAAAIAFIPGMQGNAVGLAAAGASEMAFGATLGVGAARSGGGASRGGGVATNRSGSGDIGSYTAPIRSSGQPDARGPTIVNVNVSTLHADAEIGGHIKRAVREHDAVYGATG